MSTNAEMLEKVRTAIALILDGRAIQEYNLAGKDIRRYSLRELMELESFYASKVASDSGGGRTYAEFMSP